MKSLQYMFDKALYITKEDDKSFVCFICSPEDWKLLTLREDAPCAYKVSIPNKTIEWYGGHGKIKFFSHESTNLNEQVQNWQFTHVFIYKPHLLCAEDTCAVKSRIRTRHKLTEPSGVYLPYGVERLEDY